MKAYFISTATVFTLVTLVHIWRMIEEGSHLATEPWFILATIVAAGLSMWSWRMVWRQRRS